MNPFQNINARLCSVMPQICNREVNEEHLLVMVIALV